MYMFILTSDEYAIVGTVWNVNIEWRSSFIYERMKIRHDNFEQSQLYLVSPENVIMIEHTFITSLMSCHFFTLQ
jgi:hypothetical protein